MLDFLPKVIPGTTYVLWAIPYKEEKGYKVVSKTFAKDNPQYAEKVIGFEKYFGLPFLETYICVSKNEYIINKAIIEREWLI